MHACAPYDARTHAVEATSAGTLTSIGVMLRYNSESGRDGFSLGGFEGQPPQRTQVPKRGIAFERGAGSRLTAAWAASLVRAARYCSGAGLHPWIERADETVSSWGSRELGAILGDPSTNVQSLDRKP